MNSKIIIMAVSVVVILANSYVSSKPLQQGQTNGHVRVRQMQRGTRIPRIVMAKQEFGSKHTNTGINMSLINMNAITHSHNKKVEAKKPVAQASRSRMCVFSVDVPLEVTTTSASTATPEPVFGPPSARMNTIFSSHNWGNSK